MLAKVLLIISCPGLPTPGFPAGQFVKYGKNRPVKGRLIQRVPFEVPGLGYSRQVKFVPATQPLGQAIRLASQEGFIQDHDLLARGSHIERACLDQIQRKEKSNA